MINNHRYDFEETSKKKFQNYLFIFSFCRFIIIFSSLYNFMNQFLETFVKIFSAKPLQPAGHPLEAIVSSNTIFLLFFLTNSHHHTITLPPPPFHPLDTTRFCTPPRRAFHIHILLPHIHTSVRHPLHACSLHVC